jgi:hypothetical protein
MFVRKLLVQPGMRAVVFPAFPHSLTPCALAIPTDSTEPSLGSLKGPLKSSVILVKIYNRASQPPLVWNPQMLG